MPVINKIRIVNFIYDNGMKGFTNNTFEPGGKNTLFNLVNTGGKTVLLQLILQCILPGSDLGKRKFEDFFTDNKNTSYIMLEWRMDGIEDNYLLTGMCVTGSSNEDSKVNYFMFTHQYNNKNPWDIDNINAVKHNNTLTGYNEFKKIIQEQADIKIFKSNERRKYIDHLRTFNILELEWDTIKTINLKEGGVDRFFEKSAGSKQFIEYIVIPYIESIIYEDKSQANLLAGIFDRYIENLIKIPDLQSSINLYREFLSCGDNVVTEVRQYSVLREKIEKTINELFYYITYTWEQLKVLSEEIKLIDWQIEERQIDKENLSCRRASYDLFLKILELKDIQEKINTLYMDMNKLEKFIEEKQYTVNCSTGASLLRDIENWRRELSENKTRLENISRTGEDKQYLLNRCLFSLKYLYEKECREITQKLEVLNNNIRSIKEEIKNLENEQNNLDRIISDLDRKAGNYQGKIEKFNILSERVKKKYGTQEVTFDIDKTVNDFKEYIEYSREKTDKNNSEINSSELKLHDIDIEKQRVTMKIYDVENETRDIKGEIYLYEQKLQRITLLLSTYDIRNERLFEDIPVTSLYIKKDEYEKTLKDRQVEYIKLEEKSLLLQDNFYIADGDILKVENMLKENDIAVITGSEYLSSYQDETLKKEYITGCPLLPYGLVVTCNNMEKIRKSDILKGLNLDFPVPFIIKEHIKEKNINDGENCIFFNEDIYFIHHEGESFYTSKEVFLNYKNNLSNRQKQLKDDIECINKSIDTIKEAIIEVNNFTSTYRADFLKSKVTHIEGLDKELKCLNNQLNSLTMNITELKKRKELLLNENKELSVKIIETQHKVEELQIYIKEVKEFTDNSIEKDKLDREIKLKEKKKLETGEQLVLNGKKQSELQKKIEENLKKKDELRGKLKEIILPEGFSAERQSDRSLPDLEGLRHGFEKDLKGVTGDTDSTERFIKLLYDNIERSEKSIEQLNINLSDLSDFEPLSEHGIKDIEKEINEKNLEKENLRKDMEQLNLRYALIEQKIDDSKQNILKTYNREPAIDFQRADNKIAEELEERIKSIAYKLEELNKKKENLINKSSFLKKCHDRAEIFTMDNRLKAIDGGIESYKIPFENLKEYLEERTHFYNDFKESIEKQKISVQRAYNTLSGNFGKCNEQAICNFISSVNMDSSDDELYNIHSVERVFSECITLVNRLKEICEHSLADINRHKQELVKDCKREAEKFLNEINSIDSRSGINITGHGSVKMIKIKLEHGDEQTNLDRMNLYIDRCIEDIKKDYDENGSDRNKTYSMIKSMMSSLKLIEVISDINKCRVEVFKPHINQTVKRYEPWENVLFLSGGEKYTCFFAMYISLLSFIRSKKTCQESSFVILADNPFGSTTADHLLRVLFDLIKKYNTQ
ncbi:MAG: hypothetical protein ABRQ39_19160, partial [Candidatus Eremiobacterota bacterium]